MRQLLKRARIFLQNATVITKCIVTSGNIFYRAFYVFLGNFFRFCVVIDFQEVLWARLVPSFIKIKKSCWQPRTTKAALIRLGNVRQHPVFQA